MSIPQAGVPALISLVLTVFEVCSTILIAWFACRVRWHYYGKPDRLRTYTLYYALLCLLIVAAFQMAENAIFLSDSIHTQDRPRPPAVLIGPTTATVTYSICNFFASISEFLLAVLWLRTAYALSQLLSADRRPRLLRFIRVISYVAGALIGVQNLITWGFSVYVNMVINGRYGQPPTTTAFKTLNNLGNAGHVACMLMALVVTVALMPLVIWQVLGRRTDKTALFVLLAVNSFLDTLIILDVCAGMVQLTGKLQLGSNDLFTAILQFVEIVLQTLAYSGLVIVGRRDPEKLVDEGEDVNLIWPQCLDSKVATPHGVELGADEEQKKAELAVEGTHHWELEGSEVHLLDGKEVYYKVVNKAGRNGEDRMSLREVLRASVRR